ncbi:MAG: RIP metalloprotease RseP [Chloroflexota bacterium]
MLDLLLGSSFLSSIVAFAIILIPAIIIHELGHFVAAKMVGINVLEFGIGFPPRMIRLFTWGETEFTLNWLPIGGFVRPLGEDMIGPVVETDDYDDDMLYDDDEMDELKPKNNFMISEREELMARGVPEDKLQSVNDTKPWPRIWFMTAGAVFNFVSAFLFFILAALLGLETEMGARIELLDVPAGSVFDHPDIYQNDAIDRINGEYYPDPQTLITVLSAGEPDELTLTHPRNFEEIEGAAGEQYTVTLTPSLESFRPSVGVTAVMQGSPAEEAGLQAGDFIIGLQGRSLDVGDPGGDVVAVAREFAGQEISLDIQRGDETFTVILVPRADENRPAIGIGIASLWETNDGSVLQQVRNQTEFIPQSFGDSVVYATRQTTNLMTQLVMLPVQLITGEISGEEARPVSIVGISQIGGAWLQDSVQRNAPSIILNFIAVISIALGVTNLLPLPPLDGGRILFVLIEIVRGKPVSPEIENTVYRIGIALLLILGVIVIIFDIVNPIDLAP